MIYALSLIWAFVFAALKVTGVAAVTWLLVFGPLLGCVACYMLAVLVAGAIAIVAFYAGRPSRRIRR